MTHQTGDTGGVLERVWVDGWQFGCCGDPVVVGQPVAWKVSDVIDRDFLGDVLGVEAAADVTDHQDHHDLNEGRTHDLVGTVEAIQAVWCRYVLRGSSTYFPLSGTTVVEHRQSVHALERSNGDARFVGFVVSLRSATDRREGSGT